MDKTKKASAQTMLKKRHSGEEAGFLRITQGGL